MCRRTLRYKIGVAIWLNNQQTCVRINGLPASFRMSVVSSLGSVVILDISSLLRARRGWLVAQQVVRQGQDSTGHVLGAWIDIYCTKTAILSTYNDQKSYPSTLWRVNDGHCARN